MSSIFEVLIDIYLVDVNTLFTTKGMQPAHLIIHDKIENHDSIPVTVSAPIDDLCKDFMSVLQL